MSNSEEGNILAEFISKMLEGESREQKISQVVFYGSLSVILYHYLPLRLKTESVLIVLLILESIIYLYIRNFSLQTISRFVKLIIDNIIESNGDPIGLISSIILGERNSINNLANLFKRNSKILVKLTLRAITPSILIIFMIFTITIEIVSLFNPINYNSSLVALSLSFVALLVLSEDNTKQDNNPTKIFLQTISDYKNLSKLAKVTLFLMRFLPIPKVSSKYIDTISGIYVCNNSMIEQLKSAISNLELNSVKAVYKQYNNKEEYNDIKDIIDNIPTKLKCDYTKGIHEYVKILNKPLIEKLRLIFDNHFLLKVQSKDEWAYIMLVPMKYPNNLEIGQKKSRNSNMIKVLLILGIGSNELISKLRTVLKLYAMNIIPSTTDTLEKIVK